MAHCQTCTRRRGRGRTRPLRRCWRLGYVDPTYPDKVCRLLQALYGLKQAPKMWYAKLDAFLTSQGFHNIDPDACLYLQMDDGDIIIVLVYVDDLLLVG